MQLQDCSPGMLLANLLLIREQTNQLVLITGQRGAGKTSWCLELSRQAQSMGISVVGLLSPAVFKDSRKISIDLLDIASGERRCLAERRESTTEKPEIQTENWRFDVEVLSWGNRILEQIQDSELLILDELGPLEFLHGKGLTTGLKAIETRRYQLGCLVVVRPSLLQHACERWPWGRVVCIRQEKVVA